MWKLLCVKAFSILRDQALGWKGNRFVSDKMKGMLHQLVIYNPEITRKLFLMLLFHLESGTLNPPFLVCSRKFRTSNTKVYKSRRALTACDSWTHGLLHGVWWQSLQVWKPSPLERAGASHQGGLLIVVSESAAVSGCGGGIVGVWSQRTRPPPWPGSSLSCVTLAGSHRYSEPHL